MHCGNLASILGQTFPSLATHEIASEVVQANAEGHRIKLKNAGSSSSLSPSPPSPLVSPDENIPEEVFVKQCVASNYAHKSWPDLRRTLMYIRTEIRFYNEMMPVLASRGLFRATPTVYRCEYNLEGLIPDDVQSTDPCDDVTTAWDDVGQGGFLVLESIDPTKYMQESPLTLAQCKECLTAVAKLHASAWEDTELLTIAEDRLSRGSYHLQTRNPKELKGMQQAWENFRVQFADYDPELFATCGEDLGQRVADLAQSICDELSPSATDSHTTLSHGDFKSMNVFLPRNTKDGEAILLDFASTGVGIGMSDVAMHIHHAVRAKDLADGGEQQLIDHYLEVLNDCLAKSDRHYPRDVAMRHYRLAVADYFRFFLGRFWKSATPESFEKKKASKNTSLINRDLDAALAFLRRANGYVVSIEKEQKQQQQEK